VSRIRVRPALAADLPELRRIEWAAGQRYRDYGLDHVADDEPLPMDALLGYSTDDRAWVATAGGDEPVGYILVDVIEGAAHIEQVSVAPEHQGRGVGRALVEQVAAWATTRGVTAVTLTTFGHLPWNRPLFEHMGFRVLQEDEIGVGLRTVRQVEAEHGLDPELRVAMWMDLPA
jgi:GNAT superfamily N-acetyltransferase